MVSRVHRQSASQNKICIVPAACGASWRTAHATSSYLIAAPIRHMPSTPTRELTEEMSSSSSHLGRGAGLAVPAPPVELPAFLPKSGPELAALRPLLSDLPLDLLPTGFSSSSSDSDSSLVVGNACGRLLLVFLLVPVLAESGELRDLELFLSDGDGPSSKPVKQMFQQVAPETPHNSGCNGL